MTRFLRRLFKLDDAIKSQHYFRDLYFAADNDRSQLTRDLSDIRNKYEAMRKDYIRILKNVGKDGTSVTLSKVVDNGKRGPWHEDIAAKAKSYGYSRRIMGLYPPIPASTTDDKVIRQFYVGDAEAFQARIAEHFRNKEAIELTPEYIALLEQLPEPMRYQMLYGDWVLVPTTAEPDPTA